MADEKPVETTPVQTPVEPVPTAATSILGDAVKAEEKSVEAKTEEAAKPVETTADNKVEDKKAEEPKAEDKKIELKDEPKPESVKAEEKPVETKAFEWKMPEGVKFNQERLGTVNKVFAEMEKDGKIGHDVVQKYGQQLADFHVQELQSLAKNIESAYKKAWEDGAKKWADEFLNDPKIGGNKRDTTLNAAKEFIRRHGGSTEEQAELIKLLDDTKIGNHKALIRTFANANTSMREPQKPLVAQAPVDTPKSFKEKMYGRKRAKA